MWREILEVEIIRYLMFLVAIILGWAFGNGAVYFFNRFPGKWLADYGEKPASRPSGQKMLKLPNKPWRAVFSMAFIASGIWLSEKLWLSGLDKWQMVALLTASMVCFMIILLIGLSDLRYMVLPDQLVALLAVSAIAFSPYKESFLEPLWGALIGTLTFLLLNVIFKKSYNKDVIGSGNVKLMFAAGLLMGLRGTVAVMILSFIMAGIFLSIKIVRGELRRKDEISLSPFLAASCYLCILFDMGTILF